MFKTIRKVGRAGSRNQCAHATKIEKKKEGEKKHFCRVFFSIVHGFFIQVTQSKMLRDQGTADVEKYNLKNGHESLLEAILLCHKNHEFSPSPVKGHDIYGRS